MHRFYVPPPLPVTGLYSVTGDAAHRIGRVLRMAPGERLRLFDGSGREVEAMVAGVKGDAATLTLTDELPPQPPEPELHLYQSLIRTNRFEWLLEKATELGATVIQPVVSERAQVRPVEFGPAKTARWRRILVEAAEQCERRTLPDLRGPLQLATALRRAKGVIALPWEEARHGGKPLGEALREAEGSRQRAEGSTGPQRPTVSLFIGPEGGFTAQEAMAARERGALLVSLGPRVLRAETAALAALAIAGDALGTALGPAGAARHRSANPSPKRGVE